MPFTKETARIAGSKGGKVTKKKHGLAHFARLGKKGTRIQWQKSRVKEGR